MEFVVDVFIVKLNRRVKNFIIISKVVIKFQCILRKYVLLVHNT